MIVGKIESLERCWTEGPGSLVAVGRASTPGAVEASPLHCATLHLAAHSSEHAGEKSQSVSKMGVSLL